MLSITTLVSVFLVVAPGDPTSTDSDTAPKKTTSCEYSEDTQDDSKWREALKSCDDEIRNAMKICAGPCEEAQTLKLARGKIAGKLLDNVFESQTNSKNIGGQVLQVLGQVVVDKAMESGWSQLSKKLKTLAGCEQEKKKKKKLINTCSALESVDIHDLVGARDMLLGAAFLDLFALGQEEIDAKTKQTLFAVFSGLSWGNIAEAWRTDAVKGVALEVEVLFRDRLTNIYKDNVECDGLDSDAERVAWLLGKCLSYGVDKCEVTKTIEECGFKDQSVKSTALAIVSSWKGLGDQKSARRIVNTVFEIEQIGATDERKELLSGLQDVLVGAIDGDANRAFTAAGKLFAGIVAGSLKNNSNSKCTYWTGQVNGKWDRGPCGAELFRFLIAIAQIPETEDAAERAEAVKSLIARMTRRTGRNSGVVASLGGSFGLVVGRRFAQGPGASSESVWASPIHLGLGFGLDSYHKETRAGFHGELSAFDLGQYVALNNGKVDVEEPDLRAAVSPSMKLGVHFALDETPLFVAAFGGVSPFVRTVSAGSTPGGLMTWTAGIVLGIYVPFIDFN